MSHDQPNSLRCSSLVVKVASRCNLNCSYCYMYNKGDGSYKLQPKFMSREVVEAMYQQVRTHCLTHGMDSFHIVLHGGEPMLASKSFFREFVELGHSILAPEVSPRFYIQTNGLLITPEWCEVFNELDIAVGISLDGPKAANDEYRVDHSGKGSYDRIVAGLKVAQQHLEKAPGLLCVVNVAHDPIETYEHLKSLNTPGVSFIMPDSNYLELPPQPPNSTSETPYGDWLAAIFDRWVQEPKAQRMGIKFFSRIMELVLGVQVGSDNLGNGEVEVMVIETNGDIEAVDMLKICGEGFTKGKANVLNTTFDEALATPLATLFNQSHNRLCAQCMSCPIKDVCGGGSLQHRYSDENGFNNPSVYCKDLMRIITHIQNRLVSYMPETLLKETGMEMITYEEARMLMQQPHTYEEATAYSLELENY